MISASRFIYPSLLIFGVFFGLGSAANSASAQTGSSSVLPNTFSSVAGGGSTTVKGSPCSAGSPYIATDSFGDGCPATLASFSSDTRAGLVMDPLGNIYFGDTANGLIRKIDPRSGIISVLAGGTTTNCAAAVDKEGDGCPLANAGNFNNPRGIGTDPYGNIFIAGYSDQLVHIVCSVVSPLCTATQVGTMRLLAGCAGSTTGYGTSGNTGDGGPAAVTGTCTVGLNQPRGVNADAWGNVYIGDTGNLRYRVVLGPVAGNPLVAILQQTGSPYSGVIAGDIYAFVGGPQFTVPTAAGQPCFSGSTSNALDTYGNGCPYFNTSMYTSGGFVQGIEPDKFGNVIFQDGQGSTGHIRVMYAGGTNNPMAGAITANNPTVLTPQAGFVYNIAGGGSTNGLNVNPVLGSTTSLDGSMYRTVSDAAGNIYIGDNTQILFFDISTGYIRKLAVNGSACGTPTDTIGDGCSATQATFGGSNSVTGVGLDNLGNLYIEDGTNARVREISATSFAPTAIGTPSTPSIVVHSPAGTTGLVPTLAANSDFTLGSATCITHAPSASAGSGDNSFDCTIPVTFTPTQLGLRTAPVVLQATGGAVSAPIVTALTGRGSGASFVFDPASPATPSTTQVGSITPNSIAVDGIGNVYTTSSAKVITEVSAGTTTSISSAQASIPSQLAVDPEGNIYAVTSGSATITKLSFTAPASYIAGTVTNGAVSGAKAIAVDANENVYIADNSGNIIKFSQTAGQATTLSATPLNNPVALALDGLGNVLVADKGAGVVYKVPTSGISTGLPPVVITTGISAPVGVGADSAGDIYIVDSASKQVVEVTPSGTQVTVLVGLSTPNGLAVDGTGTVYVSDSGATGITKVLRNQIVFPFGSNIGLTLNGTVTNAGNLAATGLLQTDASDFQLTGAGATCNPATSLILSGASCTIAASFNPTATGSGSVADAVSFSPAASSLGALTFTATKTGSATTTTTTISNETPASPVYVSTGTTVSFAVTVAASSGVATGNVSVTLDSGAPALYVLNASGVAAISLSGVTAGPHTLSATYPTQGGVVGSIATPFSFTVTQATTAVSWTPAAITQQFSQSIGTSALNATSRGVPGAFVYTATPTGGSAIAVDASSYLPIGTYSLSVAFTPTDSVDYSGSTGSVASYAVTKASTTAAVGASTNVVASDGSGNFASVTAAVAALPATGGTIYIAPGTYSGQFTVSYPNVALRGLGGVAQNVIITAEAGAFNAPLPVGVPPGNNGAAGDQGSSTVVVDKQTIGGTTYIPNNFYAENLSIVNTYDSDATNSNTLASVSGVCTANQPATNNFALYNAGTLCASQALALWTRSDKALFNNIRLISLQDTLYAGSQGCGSTCVPARQYFWKGYITGDVDYIFGDAAMVFDQTTFYTIFHGTTPTGTETIEAQNKMRQTGSAGDYLSGYILNSANLTSQASGMTQLYLGRPYGPYSTFVMLNTTVDQVNPLGWIEFSGDTNLPTSTYAEFNTLGAGGASVAQRETTSFRPELLTAAQAAQYAPLAFLGQGLPVAPDNWNPIAALAAGINGYVPPAATATTTVGNSITILARPQTPGGGAIPTGSYTLMDGSTVLSSGTLDASGSVYMTTHALTVGTHKITLVYGGDGNFSGSTTATPLVITVNGIATTTALAVTTSNPIYGSAVNITATVTKASGTATGTVALTVDSGAPITQPLTSGSAAFSLTGLTAGSHTLMATYSGDAANTGSTSAGVVTVAKAALTVTIGNLTVTYGNTIPAFSAAYSGFVSGDTAATALTGAPAITTTTATPASAGTYVISAATGTLVAPNYIFNFVPGTLTIGKAGSTISLSSSATSPGTAASVLFTATVQSATSGVATGSVSFLNGSAVLGTSTLNSGVATLSTSFATAGTDVITAVYAGDGNFNGSTSSAVTEAVVTPGFTVASTPATLTIPRGTTGTVTLNLSPIGGYASALVFSCGTLPAEVTCVFNPVSVTFTGSNTAQSVQLQIQTAGPNHASVSGDAPDGHRTYSAGVFFLPGLLLGGLVAVRRKQLTSRMKQLIVLMILASGMMAASGCASPAYTPDGTDSIVVTVVGASGVSQQTAISVTITK